MDQEIEVKFYISDLHALRKRLESLGAQLAHPRVLETNLRFDTPDGTLSSQRRVLRLRKDAAARMTYKGPAESGQAASIRREIEFEVSDFAAARRLLEALGYVLSVSYEKYRTEYHYFDTVVALDEMPYGSFIEIEGVDVPSIQVLASRLNLDWEARSIESYLALFQKLRGQGLIEAPNLTFSEFDGFSFSAEDLGLRPADA